MNIISTKWVYKIKRIEKGEAVEYKSRLLRRGFSPKKGIDFGESFTPKISFDTVRLLLEFCAQNNSVTKHVDVNLALLNGKHEEETFFLNHWVTLNK